MASCDCCKKKCDPTQLNEHDFSNLCDECNGDKANRKGCECEMCETMDEDCREHLVECCTCCKIWGDERGEFDEDGDFKCEDCMEEDEEDEDEGECGGCGEVFPKDKMKLFNVGDINEGYWCEDCENEEDEEDK